MSGRDRTASCPAAAASPRRSHRTAAPPEPQECRAETAPAAIPGAAASGSRVADGRSVQSYSCHYLNVNHILSRTCHCSDGTRFAPQLLKKLLRRSGVEWAMKIYLLMMLIGTLLTIIRFTPVPDQRSNTQSRQTAAR